MILELHHLQIAMPKGGEAAAREFYGTVLGLQEVEKPEVLRGRGGLWFEAGAVRIHLGIEEPFVAAKKAHPGLRVASLAEAEAWLQARAVPFRRDQDLPDMRRVHVEDPFGNRLELLELR
jgi:catechol 2,3-dioxygenase-like lactoylglutathione lyase family enzyme